MVFKIELIELSISVCANGNKKDGINVPNTPEAIIHFHSFFLIFFNLLKPIMSKKTAAIKIRKEPICKGVKPNKAFLIKINELPHTNESTSKYIHFTLLFSIFRKKPQMCIF